MTSISVQNSPDQACLLGLFDPTSPRSVLSSCDALSNNRGMESLYRGYRFPPKIISHAVWLYHRFTLSFRDVEDLLAERGIVVSYEAIRYWCLKFGPQYARKLRKKHGQLGDIWHVDEVFVRIQGEQFYLWRAAKRFFRKVLKSQGKPPWRLVTDKLRSYPAAHREVFPSVGHRTNQYENNRAEVSHQHTREKERQMRRFKPVGQAQRVLAAHGQLRNLSRVGRSLLKARHYRLLRDRALVVWREATCAH